MGVIVLDEDPGGGLHWDLFVCGLKKKVLPSAAVRSCHPDEDILGENANLHRQTYRPKQQTICVQERSTLELFKIRKLHKSLVFVALCCMCCMHDRHSVSD